MNQRLERIWSAPGARPKSGAARPARVALLDGDAAMHATFRDHLVASEPDWQLDTYTHGTPAWPALRATLPQLVLLAQTLPDGCGMEYLRRCQGQWPGLLVVILTTQGCAKTLWAALLAGANGYWVKDGNAADLVRQLRKALAGKLVLCDQAECWLPQAFAWLRQRPVDQWGLSQREHEVMISMCGHVSDKEVAVALGISDETVHVHLHNAFKKLGVHDRKTAVAQFLKVFLGEGVNCGSTKRI